MSKRTKLPWVHTRRQITGGDGEPLLVNGVSMPCGNHPQDAEATANAALIVQAVNSHAAMLEALEMMVTTFGHIPDRKGRNGWGGPAVSIAKSAIALAKGESRG